MKKWTGALTALFLFVLTAIVPIRVVAQDVATEISPEQIETWQAASATADAGLTAEAQATEVRTPTPEGVIAPVVESIETPTPEATEESPGGGGGSLIDPPTPEEAAEQVGATASALIVVLEAFLMGFVGTAINSPATTAIVSLWKRIPAFENWSARVMNLTVATGLTLIAMAAGWLGLSAEADRVFVALAQGIPILMMLFGAPVASSLIYKAERAEKVPVLGYSRTPPSVRR